MTDELTHDDVAATIAKAKQPRVMKQPTKEQLRRELESTRAAFHAALAMHDEVKKQLAALESRWHIYTRAPWWMRWKLTRKPK